MHGRSPGKKKETDVVHQTNHSGLSRIASEPERANMRGFTQWMPSVQILPSKLPNCWTMVFKFCEKSKDSKCFYQTIGVALRYF
jgi:hypothetical protein